MADSWQDSNASPAWIADLEEIAQFALDDAADDSSSVLCALDQALAADDRLEILAQFNSVAVSLARDKRWRAGKQVSQRVYDAVRKWCGFDPCPYARTLAQFTFNYALQFQQSRSLGAAKDLLREAIRLFEELSDEVGITRGEYELGRVLQEQGEFNSAQQYFHLSLARARTSDDHNYICRNLLQLGQIAHLQGDLTEGADWYHQALTIARETGHALVVIAASHQLGLVAQERGALPDASNWFRDALTSSEKIGDARSAADALHQMGMIAQSQGALDRADELYRSSLKQAAKLADSAPQGPTLYQLARCANLRGDVTGMEKYCGESLSIFQAQGDLDGIRRVRQLLNSSRVSG